MVWTYILSTVLSSYLILFTTPHIPLYNGQSTNQFTLISLLGVYLFILHQLHVCTLKYGMCACMGMCVYAHTYVGMHIEARDQPREPPTWVFETGSFTGTWSSQTRLGWLNNNIQGSTYLLLSNSEGSLLVVCLFVQGSFCCC